MRPFTVMTFNIRYDEPADGRHAWAHRRGSVIDMIRAHDPDLLGLQEAMPSQWDEIAAALPDRAPFGVISEDEGSFDPQGGFIRRARFDVRGTGLFWLSETPDETGSVSWPNDWGARACGWARVHDRVADRQLVFACTHFDTNEGAWLPSAQVLHAELDQVAAGDPLVVVGDFNCAAGRAAHRYLCDAGGFRDAWTDAGHDDAGVVTFNGFKPVTHLPAADAAHDHGIRNYRIDWVLLRGPLMCSDARIDCRHDDGLMPSDHYPVIAAIDWDHEGTRRQLR